MGNATTFSEGSLDSNILYVDRPEARIFTPQILPNMDDDGENFITIEGSFSEHFDFTCQYKSVLLNELFETEAIYVSTSELRCPFTAMPASPFKFVKLNLFASIESSDRKTSTALRSFKL